MSSTALLPIPSDGGLLVIDQGSHATKALVYAPDGGLLASTEVPVETAYPRPGWAEHDAEALAASVFRAVDEACSRLGAAPRIAAAGLATQRSTLVCWHAGTGEPLSPAISWQDRRNAEWLAGLGLDADRVRRITGLVPTPHYGMSKFRWCLDHLPQVAAARRHGQLRMGPLSSFLTARLAGGGAGRDPAGNRPMSEPVVDPANASRTLLWDVACRDWSGTMLRHAGLTRDVLPACVPSRFAHGMLDTPTGPVPLTVCTGDQPATLFHAGPADPATIYVNLGTGAFLQRPAGSGPAPDGLLESVCWQEGGQILQVHEGTVNGAGAALSWLAGRESITEQELFEAAPVWLARENDPPLFLNGVGGLGAPFWVADCEIAFDREADRAARTVAVIESIVFLLQANLDALRTVGPEPSRFVVGGGLSRLDGLCQRLADLGNLPVERVGDPEATARGLAWLLRHDPLAPEGDETPAGPSGTATRFVPVANPALHARYDAWRTWLSRSIN